MNKIFPLLMVSSAVLYACNPSNNPDEQPTEQEPKVSYGGKVIDGYVSGATVFLDLNVNAALDANEPSAVSKAGGQFDLNLTEAQAACLAYVPVVVDVPVGAVDEDLGAVTEAYQMTLPPTFEAVSTDAGLNVTPLTSAVWSALRAEQGGSTPLSCEQLKDNEVKIADLASKLESAIGNLVTHYNLSEAQIFSDFVSENDMEAKDKAQEIVRGLQQGLTETLALQDSLEDGEFGYVQYHQFDARDFGANYPDAWYRETYTWQAGRTEHHLEKMEDDFSAPIRTIIYGLTDLEQVNNASFRLYHQIESRKGDGSTYTCVVEEGVFATEGGRTYKITNFAIADRETANFANCQTDDYSDPEKRYAFVNETIAEVDYSAQFTYFYNLSDEGTLFSSTAGLFENRATFDVDALIDDMAVLPYGFEEVGNGEADLWTKTKTYYDGQNRKIVETKSLSDINVIKRKITETDGTSTEDCSFDGGDTWTSCHPD